MRIASVVLTAAALLGCADLTTGVARAADARALWSDLWRTPDQQGQALLDAGQPAQAAARFADPRRRAYADLEAGRYQQAAKLLAPFTDAGSEYNRGNALAESGQLEGALAAYDAALRQAPADKDIRHNRDLIERELRRQRQSPQSSSRNAGGNGRQSGSGPRQPSGAGQQSGPGSQQSGSHPQDATASGQQPAASTPSGSNGPQTGARSPDTRSRQQAQRDAAMAAALARSQQQAGKSGKASPATGPDDSARSGSSSRGNAPDRRDRMAGGTQTPRQKPETERQLALDQWLRQIPDSPAGLLQRKFLIEHMMRQQESGSAGDGP